MKHTISRCLALLLVVSLLFSFGGCTSNKEDISEATMARLEELAQDFVNELEVYIIPAKENNEELIALDMTVSTQQGSYNVDAVRDFYTAYTQKKNGMVTFAFTSTSFVVTRVVAEGNYYYYLRYQHDPKAGGEDLPITSMLLTEMELVEDADLNKVELTLRSEKAKPKVFSFKNIVSDAAENEAE